MRRSYAIAAVATAIAGAVALTTVLIWIYDARPFFQALDRNVALARAGTPPLPSVTSDEAIVVVTGDFRRIPRAFQLLLQRNSPLLVITGARPGSTKAQLLGVPGGHGDDFPPLDRVVLETDAASTRENADKTRDLLRARGVRRVVLVTSDYHMYRTLAVFRSLADEYEYLPYPVPSEAGDHYLRHHSLSLHSKIANEFFKLLVYKHLYGTFDPA